MSTKNHHKYTALPSIISSTGGSSSGATPFSQLKRTYGKYKDWDPVNLPHQVCLHTKS